ncbi:hypothetical protein R5R35_011244 [Gryllus longicercus]|uniref:Accessory gland protein n=1 Tax=Gryllus longicercus TaxID=2509291 RepID=A0AAN9W215_9ORTH
MTPLSTRSLALLCLSWVLASLLLSEDAAAAAVRARNRARLPRRRARARIANSTADPGYKRFHANDSYIGEPIPCTDDEKVCFGYNLVLDTDSDTCQAIGGGYVGGCVLRADRKEFEETSGRLYGVCQEFDDPCRGVGFRMANDGRCYTPDIVRNVLCGCDAPPTFHLLGNYECRCTTPSAPVRVEQPKEAGRCKIPDFRFPDTRREQLTRSALQSVKIINSNCSAQQRECFGEHKVWVAEAAGCFPLLKRGPCAADEVVVLTKQQWTAGAAVCRQERGDCPPGRLRMGFDGECHSEREMKIAAPGRLALNILGEYDVLGYNQVLRFTPKLHGNACAFDRMAMDGSPPYRAYPKPVCTGSEPQCALYETISVPPSPE